ncbi:hypothetical protein LSUE1_G003904 [Lachnellula suecica]|uniref:Uncharacterized protein n=1 Tax=Lachnellula suecica TaxID=602035 RepID=A0A8T9C5H0_9HELO|nr:hypothetical protein LSUE1_G003904 [Lachnellula suecica]
MDVTSLLNANAMSGTGNGTGCASDAKKNDGSRSIRSRTPWDAGGYSLPIMSSNPAVTAAAMTPPLPAQHTIHCDDSRIDSPSPTHKFSDSRSSLSSFASSIQSTSHSRFSSTSTVSSSYPLNGWEVISPKSTAVDLASPHLSTSAPPSEARSASIAGINESLETLCTIAEHHTTPEDEQQIQHELEADGARTFDLPRPSSPSDAILIKRTAIPTLRLDTSSYDPSRVEPRDICPLCFATFEWKSSTLM